MDGCMDGGYVDAGLDKWMNEKRESNLCQQEESARVYGSGRTEIKSITLL